MKTPGFLKDKLEDQYSSNDVSYIPQKCGKKDLPVLSPLMLTVGYVYFHNFMYLF